MQQARSRTWEPCDLVSDDVEGCCGSRCFFQGVGDFSSLPSVQDLRQASTALTKSSQKGSPHAGSVICNWSLSTIACTGSPAHIYDSSQADSGAASIHANTEGQGAGDRETELVTPPSVGDTCTSLSPPPWNTKYPSTPKPKKYFQLADLTSSMW